MTDLVKRLRTEKYSADVAHPINFPIMQEAADEIERLSKWVKDAYQYDSEDVDRWMFEAENKRLREALIKIRGWREIGGAVTPMERLFAIEVVCDEALKERREK